MQLAEGEEGGRERSVDFLEKKFLIVFIYGLNFVIQNAVLRVPRRKTPKSLPVGAFLLCALERNVY